MHAAKQDLRCVGCSGHFTRAAALMEHIEHKRCPVISMAFVERNRAHKELVKSFLRDPTAYDASSTTADSVDDGGASLGSDSATVVSESDGGVLLPSVASAHWPKLETLAFKDGGQEDLLTGIQSLEIKEPVTTWGLPAADLLFHSQPMGKENERPKREGGEDCTPNGDTVDEGKAKSEADMGTTVKTTRVAVPEAWDPESKQFDARRFLDGFTMKYLCPHPSCT